MSAPDLPAADERARALRALPGEALVPVSFFLDLLPAPGSFGSPLNRTASSPSPHGWSVRHLATHYGWSPTKVKKEIAAGTWGEPDTAGGPVKRGTRWYVPHATVLAVEASTSDATGIPTTAPATADPSAPAPVALVGITTLAERRRQREEPHRRRRASPSSA